MKQNKDLKADATFKYANMPYGQLEAAFNELQGDNQITSEERRVLEIIWATRYSIEPFRYQLWRISPEYFEMLFGHEARDELNKAFALYQESKLVDMDEFKHWCNAELVNI